MSEPNPDWPSLDSNPNQLNTISGTTKRGGRIGFAALVGAIIISWIVVAFFTRSIENLFFIKLKFDGESFWQTFFVAIVIAIFFLGVVWTIEANNVQGETNDASVNRIVEFDAPLAFRDLGESPSNIVFSN